MDSTDGRLLASMLAGSAAPRPCLVSCDAARPRPAPVRGPAPLCPPPAQVLIVIYLISPSASYQFMEMVEVRATSTGLAEGVMCHTGPCWRGA